MFTDPNLESVACDAVAVDEPEKLLARFATLTRESGTPDEHAAADYIADRLRALGVPFTVHRPDLFLSIPERAELLVEGDTIRCRPPAFARSTGGAEISGAICYVPSQYAGGTGDLFDTPSAASAEPAPDPVPGTDDPDEFLLVHGHYDSWYVGIGDNATGDATLLELARVLHALRGKLRRSVRVAWWPGHSTGRYAGSTWYADHAADDLDEWCIAHLNIDSPGCREATAYEEVMWMAEASAVCTSAIADALGVRATGMRPLRAGDYSFNQIGPTAFYMLLSNIPTAERKARGYYAVGGNGGSPTWHTPNDLPPVADLTILRRDLAVYLTTI